MTTYRRVSSAMGSPVDGDGSSGLGQDGDGRDGAGTAEVVSESEASILHLHLAGLTDELIVDVGDHALPRRPDRVAARLEPARRVDGQIATQSGDAVLCVAPPRAGLRKAEIFVVHDLGDGEAVVALGDVDLLRGVADSGHRVGGLRGLARRAEGREVPRGIA